MQAPTGRDAASLLDAAYALACVTARADLQPVAVRWALALVPADRGGWVHVDVGDGRISGYHAPQQIPVLLEQFPRDLRSMPLVDGLVERPGLDVRKISDHLTRREWHRTRIYAELYGPNDAEYQMAAPVTMLDPRVRGRREFESLSLIRARGDFTERDRAVLTELSRHVRAARSRLCGDSGGSAAGAAARHGLTPRQYQALQAIADGSTMRLAARRLGVTEKTLENHLQAAYRRLGVLNRVAALSVLGVFPYWSADHGTMEWSS